MNGTFLKVPFNAFITTGFGLEQPGKRQQNMVLSQSLPQTEVRLSCLHCCQDARIVSSEVGAGDE